MPFVFGYGSLLNLCNHNTNDALYYVKLMPSNKFSVRRSFNAQSDKSINIPNCYTALGIEFVEYERAQPINGLIFFADELKLQKLIEREKNYKIVELNVSLFEIIKTLNIDKLTNKLTEQLDEKIIMFVPLKSDNVSVAYPLDKKYIDICLDGFLSVDKAFAYDFINTTYGWSDELLVYARNYVNGA
jgi:hypothetical protein